MKISIYGAGAIGGMAGVHMAMNGEDVTFIDQWREHVEAMQTHGLRIDGVRGAHTVPVHAILPEAIAEPMELVFLAVKSQHTDQAMRTILPHLHPNATVVSLQNGYNVENIAALIGAERVIGTVPDYTAALVDPGFLEFTNGGPIYLGELDGKITPRVREIERLLAMVTNAVVTDNIIGRIWTKQCYACQLKPTVAVDASIPEVLRSERNRLMGVALAREAIAVADRAGVTLERDAYFQPELIRQRSPEARRKQLRVLQVLSDHFSRKDEEMPQNTSYQFVKKGSGMWWDIVYRRRKSETRWLTGALLDRAERLGIPTPLNNAMVNIIYEIEDGKRTLGWHNLDEVARVVAAAGEPLSVADTVAAR